MITAMKVVYFAATLFVLLIVCDASDEPKCKQGESYEKDCNTCHCTDAGVEVCTERACYNGPQFPDTAVEDHTEIPETNGQVCTPNETKMQDCNRCRCSANGIVWICTRRFCPSTPAPKIPVNEPGFTCVPNQVFKDDCNTCSCDESGTLARCTAMACEPTERRKRSNVAELITTTEIPVLKGNDCVPGTRWKQECNWCWCSEHGFAACTLKGCLGHGPKFHKFHAAPDALATTEAPEKVGDNSASLLKAPEAIRNKRQTGKNPQIVIDPPSDTTTPKAKVVNDPSRLSPPPNSKKSKQNQGNQAGSSPSPVAASSNVDPVTLRPGVVDARPTATTPRFDYHANDKVLKEADLKNPNFTCTPSESFKVECNTCWCAANGKGVRYCTRQACHPKTYPTLSPAQ